VTRFSQHPMTCALLGSLVFMSSPASAGTRPAAGEGISVLVQAADGRMLGAAAYNESAWKRHE
jgi:hypothetical protein